jgi:lipoprotein-anchoring transpeptidase ErfK/SrfK
LLPKCNLPRRIHMHRGFSFGIELVSLMVTAQRRIKLIWISALAVAIIFAVPTYAAAEIVITINKSVQRLSVTVDGAPKYEWPISTARRGYRTPNGTYRPEWLARKWFSRKYDWSPMPYSIFFDGGYAIHGSYEISRLGRPASHGCIRLHPKNAAILFALVKGHMKDTRIVVIGEEHRSIR